MLFNAHVQQTDDLLFIVRCFSAFSTIFSSVCMPLRLRMAVTIWYALFFVAKLSPHSSISSSVVGFEKGSSSSTLQCENCSCGCPTAPEVCCRRSFARPRLSVTGMTHVIVKMSVPSQMSSFSTSPR